jgi:hypothetical protein
MDTDNKDKISILFDAFLDKLEEHWKELNKLKDVGKEKTRLMPLLGMGGSASKNY